MCLHKQNYLTSHVSLKRGLGERGERSRVEFLGRSTLKLRDSFPPQSVHTVNSKPTPSHSRYSTKSQTLEPLRLSLTPVLSFLTATIPIINLQPYHITESGSSASAPKSHWPTLSSSEFISIPISSPSAKRARKTYELPLRYITQIQASSPVPHLQLHCTSSQQASGEEGFRETYS
jgi:hypothetical protein